MNLKELCYKNKQVRTVEKEGAFWWVLKDVCAILEIEKYRDAGARLDDDERGSVLVDTPGGKQEMVAVNESGLYSVIMQSRKPEAKDFKRWVTHEVLPSIRQTGAYMTPQTIESILASPDTIIALAMQLKELQASNKAQAQVIGELRPKADYVDSILKSRALITITAIAKDYGMSGQKLNEILHAQKVQYKRGEQWFLYEKYHDKGYTQSETVEITRSGGYADVKLNTKWTQKGRLFLHELLKSLEIYPNIEKSPTP